MCYSIGKQMFQIMYEVYSFNPKCVYTAYLEKLKWVFFRNNTHFVKLCI